MAERRLPSNLQHFNRLLTEYAKQDNGMPVSRARHAIGVIVICSMIDRVRDTEGGHLFVAKGGSAMQLRLGPAARAAEVAFSVEVPPVVDVAERLAVTTKRFVQRLCGLVVPSGREPELG